MKATQGNTMIIVLMIIFALGLVTVAMTVGSVLEGRSAQYQGIRSLGRDANRGALLQAQQLLRTDVIRDAEAAARGAISSSSVDPLEIRRAIFNRLENSYCDGTNPGGSPNVLSGKELPSIDGETSMVRFYITASACGSPLPTGSALPSPTRLTALSTGYNTIIELPMLIVVSSMVGQSMSEMTQPARLQLEIGDRSVSRMQLLIDRQDEAFDELFQADGPVAVRSGLKLSGIPRFGSTLRSQGEVQIEGVGKLQPSELRPSPDRPCYAATCPVYSAPTNLQASLPDIEPGQLESRMAGGRTLLINKDLAGLEIWIGPDPNRASGSSDPSVQIPVTPQRENHQWIHVIPLDPTSPDYTIDNGLVEGEDDRSKLPPGEEPPRSNARYDAIYVDGQIESLSGAPGLDGYPMVARGQALTIAARGDITISSSLRLTDSPCSQHMYPHLFQNDRPQEGLLPASQRKVDPAVCENLMHTNVIGVISELGDVILGTDQAGFARSVTIQASLWAPSGTVRRASHTQPSPDGEGRYINLLGSVAVQRYTSLATDAPDEHILRQSYDPRLGTAGAQAGIVTPRYFNRGSPTVLGTTVMFGQSSEAN